MTLYDNHIHVINPATTPPALAAGRFDLSRAEMSMVLFLSRFIDSDLLPDTLEGALEVVDDVLKMYSSKWRRLRTLLALWNMSIEKQVKLISRMLKMNGVAGGNILLLPGTPAAAIYETIGACDGSLLRVFVPWIHANIPGVAGIKHYPSLQGGQWLQCADTACALDLPVISHCSPGGVRASGMGKREAVTLNQPGKWLEIVRDRPIRLCLAHGGGGKWAKRLASNHYHADTLDYMTREAHPPTEWGGRLWVDTAFHDGQGTDAYRRAVMAAGAPWRVLWGSDFPFHLSGWSYQQAAARGRCYWGDQVAAQAEFTVVRHENN